MTVAGDAVFEIRTGPRWDAVLTAMAEAEDVLGVPLSEEELEDGWTEDLRSAILADLRRVRAELSSRPDGSVVLEDWSAVDAIDTGGDALRVDVIFDVDMVLGELERAERALLEARALLGELAAKASSSDVETGFDDDARAELRAMLEVLCHVLETGEYLSAQEMDPWGDALRSYGFLRAGPRPGLQDAAASGFTRQRIEQFPPGRRWERLAIFDGWLTNVAATDVLDEDDQVDEEIGDDDEEAG